MGGLGQLLENDQKCPFSTKSRLYSELEPFSVGPSGRVTYKILTMRGVKMGYFGQKYPKNHSRAKYGWFGATFEKTLKIVILTTFWLTPTLIMGEFCPQTPRGPNFRSTN